MMEMFIYSLFVVYVKFLNRKVFLVEENLFGARFDFIVSYSCL